MTDNDPRVAPILLAATQKDPSIDPKAAAVIALACLDELATHPEADPAQLARCCLARYPAADASWVAHLARAAVRHAESP